MTIDPCPCLGDDTLAALAAVRKSRRIAMLVDESHFGVAILRCVQCGQTFLSIFCERVDWADSDDPQIRVTVPISDDEARRLRAADMASDENAILRTIVGERRFLFHDMPKGAGETLAWMKRTLFIPAHD